MRPHLTVIALFFGLAGGLAPAQSRKAAPQADKVAMREKTAGSKSDSTSGKVNGCEHASKA